MLLTLIIVLGLFCLVWWLIGYAAPPGLVKPLRIVLAIVLVIYLVTVVLPGVGVTL
jgi:hypothetical protein